MKRIFSRLDGPLLLIVGLLVISGLVAVYSATRGTGGASAHFFLQRQLLWLVVGSVALVLALLFDYEWLARLHRPIYALCLLVLFGVLVIGSAAGGSVRWIALGPFRFQPSELTKLGLIIVLAAFLSKRTEGAGSFRSLLGSLLLMLIPAGLVMIQPDFGTALVLSVVWLAIVLAAQAKPQHLLALLLVFALVFAAAWQFRLLRPHQRQRLATFLHPKADPLGTGYQRWQAIIGVGSGQLLGKGLFQGTQGQLRFIPEHHTDFIFTVVAEETGSLGSGLLLLLYYLLIWRCLQIGREARDELGGLLATGLAAMFGFHVFVNIGMTMGLVPVTGIPLPFLSYGGSNLLLNMIAVGLLLGIRARREKLIF